MAAVFYIVALLMVAGGGWALYTGYPIIVVERGWALVIAGTVALSSGLLLAGIAAMIGRLGRLNKLLATASIPAQPTPITTEPASLPPLEPAIVEAPKSPVVSGRKEPALPVEPDPDRDRDPDLDDDAEAGERPAPALAGELRGPLPDSEPKRDLVPGPRPAPPVVSPAPPVPVAPVVKPAAQELAPPEMPPPEVVSSEVSPDSAAKPPELGVDKPTVIGRHESGKNVYVMWSDGSIEAETPTGNYRFESLEELRAFIDGNPDA